MWIVLWDPVLKLILPDSVFADPANSIRDPRKKCKCAKHVTCHYPNSHLKDLKVNAWKQDVFLPKKRKRKQDVKIMI